MKIHKLALIGLVLGESMCSLVFLGWGSIGFWTILIFVGLSLFNYCFYFRYYNKKWLGEE